MRISDIKFDCIYFKGEVPCNPNKERGKICNKCDEYKPLCKRILIIKLGAIGDVIRTTPLIVKFRELYPDSHITWITHSPDILPAKHIDRICKWDINASMIALHQHYDIAVNLDKEYEACALLADVRADEKYGFTLHNHRIAPATPAAVHKLMTGLFDEFSKENTKSYLQEIFEICHFSFNNEEYLMDVNEDYDKKWEAVLTEKAQGKKIIGLNTGCGARWLTRLWPEENWMALIKQLQNKGYYPVVLGGPDEDERNMKYAKETGCYYPGMYSLQEFIALSNNMDIILTAVSMMMHIATALKKKMILFVNIFNAHEFELYGRGEIISPPTGCDCFYGSDCKRERHCMKDINVEMVLDSIERHI